MAGDLLPHAGVLLIAYLVGGIPFGYLIGRLNGVDIREHGSGNIGATNVLRVCGRRWGLICFAADLLKGFLPVWLAVRTANACNLPQSAFTPLAAILGTVAGHVWTPYLRFRGGKGIATSAGAVAAVAPLAVLCAFGIWAAVFLLSRYVSLASLAAAVALPLAAALLPRLSDRIAPVDRPILGLLAGLAVLVIVRHRGNLQRLVQGRELKFKRRSEDSANRGTQ
jgi:acyl phosphate:glycerol-3-phosphate acyltransferase